jgi:hypothetical protein
MTEVLRRYEAEFFPSSNDLQALSDEEVQQSSDAAHVFNNDTMSMLMHSLGKLNGSEMSRPSSVASSPRGSPRGSTQNLLNMATVWETFESNIAMNTGVKSQPDLVALGLESDNRLVDSDEASLLLRFMKAVDKFLDVDGADDGSHMLVC